MVLPTRVVDMDAGWDSSSAAPRAQPQMWPSAMKRASSSSLLNAAHSHALARNERVCVGQCEVRYSYQVRSGNVAVEAAMPRRHVIGFWLPGEVLTWQCLPLLPQLSIRATADAELFRLRASALDVLLAEQRGLASAYSEHSERSFGRLVLLNAMLGSLGGEERVASFLISTAARQGLVGGNGAQFDVEHCRTDIAAHLGLNPDTLSRFLARLQESGIIALSDRRTVVVRDWRRLCACSPLADVLSGSPRANSLP